MRYVIIFIATLLITACGEEKTFDAMGRFEATDVIVSSEVPGKIVDLDISEGAAVDSGVVTCVIDTVQLCLERRHIEAQIETQLSSRPDIKREVSALRTQIEKQKKEEQRFKKLVAEGAAPTKQLDDITAQLHVLEGNLDALLSRLGTSTVTINNSTSALRVRMEQISDNISRCYVRTPISGTVLSKYVERGEVVQPGKPLFKIADMNKMFLRSYFTSEQLAKVKLGDKVRVVADFGGDERREYQGIITNIASESEFTPKTIQTPDSRADLVYAVKIAVKNDGMLKIGFTGEVYL